MIDGEAVVLGVDGISDFNALHSRRHDEEVQLHAFDCLALDGEDLRGLPLSMRKTNLARLLARRPDGIFAAPFEQGEVALFSAACSMRLEGMLSKRADRRYRAGRSPDWVKIKNRKHPASNWPSRHRDDPPRSLRASLMQQHLMPRARTHVCYASNSGAKADIAEGRSRAKWTSTMRSRLPQSGLAH